MGQAAKGAGKATGGPIVVPDLRSGERNKQTEYDTQYRQHARRNRLERFCALPRRKCRAGRENDYGKQIGKGENSQCHKRHRQIVYPVAHCSPGALPARQNIPDGILPARTRRVLITRLGRGTEPAGGFVVDQFMRFDERLAEAPTGK